MIAALAIGQTLIILTAGRPGGGRDRDPGDARDGQPGCQQRVPGGLALLIGFAVGTICGLINGLLVTRLNLPPFIATLGTLSIYTAIGLLYSGVPASAGTTCPPSSTLMGTRFAIGPFRLTLGVIVVAVLAVIVAFVLSQTSWGRHLYAVGDDIEAARLVGIQVDKVLLSVTPWRADLRLHRLGDDRPGWDGEPERDRGRQPGDHHRGRDRRHQPVRRSRRHHRHHPGALIVYAFNNGLALAGVDDQLRNSVDWRADHRRGDHRPVDQKGEGMTSDASNGDLTEEEKGSGSVTPVLADPAKRCCRVVVDQDLRQVVGLDGVNVDLFPGEVSRSSVTTAPVSRRSSRP